VLVGDDSKRIAEAERLAEKEIGCKILRSSSYFRAEGHVQVLLAAPAGALTIPASACMRIISHAHLTTLHSHASRIALLPLLLAFSVSPGGSQVWKHRRADTPSLACEHTAVSWQALPAVRHECKARWY
jgi:hypothetical protein